MRIKHIDVLRGVAALMVTIFHLTGNSNVPGLSQYGRYGYLGVEMFFVISGFVLPYSLYKSDYRLKNFFRFLIKRIIRIHPPYVVAIGISLALALATRREIIAWQGILLHLVFLNKAFNYNDISPVFWTLKVEFCFYIFIGIFLPYFMTSGIRSLIITAGTLILSIIPGVPDVITWFSFFAFGLLIFGEKSFGLKPILFWIMVAVISLINLKLHGLAETVAGLLALLFIMYCKMEYFQKKIGQLFLWLGMISYSLYLIHWDIGRAAISVLGHISITAHYDILKVLIGILTSVGCAYGLYKLVEFPVMIYARQLDKTSSNYILRKT